MFYYLNGELAYRDASTLVVDCGGVGYKLTVSLITSELFAQKLGKTVKLFTHLAVREDGIEMFGFASSEEKECFNLLIGVSGVGPKAAINILSVMSPDKLTLAICTEDIKAIAKAQNVGAKTAARIVLELKDKLKGQAISTDDDTTLANDTADILGASNKRSDALSALTVLGYTRGEAEAVLKKIDTATLEVDDIIKEALKRLMR
jgi:Holliday junction DNA helicase RuvA